MLLSLGILAFVLSFLCWQVAGKFLPLVDTMSGSLEYALPLILGALAGVIGERSGVVNVAIEGQFLMGAFGAALIGTLATSVWAGLISAMIGGLIIAAMLAVLAIRFLVDQVVVGIVLNLFAVGITGFLYERLMQPDALKYNQPPALPRWEIPVLSDIPVIGPVLFHTTSWSGSPSCWSSSSTTRSSGPAGGCAPGRSASIPSRPTRSASGCAACAT